MSRTSTRPEPRPTRHRAQRSPLPPYSAVTPIVDRVAPFYILSYRTTVTDLSDELLLLVLRFLDTRSFLRCRRLHRDLLAVSHSDDASCWEYSHFQPRQREVFLSTLPSFDYLKSLDLTLLPAVTDADLHSILLHCSKLTAIDLSCCWALSNRAFLSLSRLLGCRLRSVCFPSSSTQRLDSVAVSFPCMAHVGLTSIELSGCSWLSQDNLIHLNSLNSLQSLRLPHMRHLGSSCLSFLRCNSARCVRVWPSLTALSLYGCVGVDDETMASVARLPRLQTLDVSGCWRVSGAGVRLLTTEGSLCSKSVEELLLEGCSVQAMGESISQCLQSMPALTALQLPQCYHPASASAEQRLLTQLLSMSGMTKLELTEWSVTETDIMRASEQATARLQCFTLRAAALKRSLSFLSNAIFATLTSLALESVDVHEWDEKQAEVRLTALRYLSLKRSPQVHRMLPLLVRNAPLLSLNVGFCQSMDDVAWTMLVAHCKSLGTLHVQATPVSHAAMAALSALPKLHTLNLFQSLTPATTLSLFTQSSHFPALATLCLTVDHWNGWQQWKRDVAAAHPDVLIREEGEEVERFGGGELEEDDEADEDWEPIASDSDDWREEEDDEKEEERVETEMQAEDGAGLDQEEEEGTEEDDGVSVEGSAQTSAGGVASGWDRPTMVTALI